MNKSAREMFINDLDLEYREDKTYISIYDNNNRAFDKPTEFIRFDKESKMTHFEPFPVDETEYSVDFFMEEAKAISQQWKELGWLDD